MVYSAYPPAASSTTIPARTSQRYANVKSMIRFSMARSFPFHRSAQQLRLENETAAHDDLLSGLQSLEHWSLAVHRFADPYRANRKAVGRRAHENRVLGIDLLYGVGDDQQGRFVRARGNFRVGQHFRAKAI